MMPRRKRTRAEELKARITAERQINELCLERQQRLKRQRFLVDELEQIRRVRGANDPPPF